MSRGQDQCGARSLPLAASSLAISPEGEWGSWLLWRPRAARRVAAASGTLR